MQRRAVIADCGVEETLGFGRGEGGVGEEAGVQVRGEGRWAGEVSLEIVVDVFEGRVGGRAAVLIGPGADCLGEMDAFRDADVVLLCAVVPERLEILACTDEVSSCYLRFGLCARLRAVGSAVEDVGIFVEIISNGLVRLGRWKISCWT